MKNSEPGTPIDLAAWRREKRLRPRLLALLAEPETQLLMRADNVDAEALLTLLMRTADGLATKVPQSSPCLHHRSQQCGRERALLLLKRLVDLRCRFENADR
jgi:hypothetical protein